MKSTEYVPEYIPEYFYDNKAAIRLWKTSEIKFIQEFFNDKTLFSYLESNFNYPEGEQCVRMFGRTRGHENVKFYSKEGYEIIDVKQLKGYNEFFESKTKLYKIW